MTGVLRKISELWAGTPKPQERVTGVLGGRCGGWSRENRRLLIVSAPGPADRKTKQARTEGRGTEERCSLGAAGDAGEGLRGSGSGLTPVQNFLPLHSPQK